MHRTVPKLRLGLPTTSVDDCTCLYPEPAEWNTRDAGYIVRAASTCCVERICATVKSEQAIRLTASSGVYNNKGPSSAAYSTQIFLLRNQMLETQLLAVGPFANSSWIDLQMRCAQHDDSGAADVTRSTSSLLGWFGESALPVVSTLRPKVTSWFAHGRITQGTSPPKQMQVLHEFTRSLQTEE